MTHIVLNGFPEQRMRGFRFSQLHHLSGRALGEGAIAGVRNLSAEGTRDSRQLISAMASQSKATEDRGQPGGGRVLQADPALINTQPAAVKLHQMAATVEGYRQQAIADGIPDRLAATSHMPIGIEEMLAPGSK